MNNVCVMLVYLQNYYIYLSLYLWGLSFGRMFLFRYESAGVFMLHWTKPIYTMKDLKWKWHKRSQIDKVTILLIELELE